ncbi:MAG: hypothetical protein R3Y13_01720 [bacterium]
MKIVYTILIVLIIVFAVYLLFTYKKKVSLVKENSAKLRRLDELNRSFDYSKKVKKNLNIIHYVTDKETLTNMNTDEIFKDLFLSNLNNSLMNFESVKKNEEDYFLYECKYNNLEEKTQNEIIKLTGLSKGMFNFLEKKIYKSRKKVPTVSTKITFNVKYDSLKGENKYKVKKVYTYLDLCDIYSQNKK